MCSSHRPVEGADSAPESVTDRLEVLRGALRAEDISYGELHELQSLARHIQSGDVELLEAAGVREFPDSDGPCAYCGALDGEPCNADCIAREAARA